MTSLFMDIENTPAMQESAGNYFLPSRFRVRIENVFIYKKRLGGHLFVVETIVLGSDNQEVKIGEQYNWVQPVEMDAAMSRVKLFIGAAKGLCPKRQLAKINEVVTSELCDRVVSTENILKGVEIDLDCFNKRSMKTGKDFTIHMWSPAKEGSMEKN